jgi:hypothetical protein
MVITMFRSSFVHTAIRPVWGLALLAATAAGCDKMPLLAPSSSTITVNSSERILPTGGTAEVSAFVAEQSGTPVQNGTVVRFTTNLGRFDPVEAQTRNGLAIATFHAGDVAGVADVRATSGATGAGGSSAGGGTGTATTASSNVVQITVGAAAVDTVVLRATPQSVPNSGGTSDLVAAVVATGGRALAGVPVSFSASEGQLTSSRVTTDEFGEARTQLVLGQAPTTGSGTGRPTASVTATAGSKTSTAVPIVWQDAQPAPTVTLAAAGDASTAIGHRWTFTATVANTTPASLPTRFDWDFGDGGTASTNGNLTAYVYTGSARGKVQRVTVRVTLANGQTISTITDIIVLAFP